MKKEEPPVVVEQTFDVPIMTVWRAITDPVQMRQWYFDNIPDFQADVGFETRFLVQIGGRDFPHLWKVTEVVPGRKIAYDWRFEGYPGDSYVSFELSANKDQCKLTLTAVVREDFPDEVPEFSRESCVAGWEYFIQKSLKDHLDNV